MLTATKKKNSYPAKAHDRNMKTLHPENEKSKLRIKKMQTRRAFKKRKKDSYSVHDLQNALNAMSEGISLRRAADMFRVPKSTLHSKFNNKTPLKCKRGPQTIMSTEEENSIVEWILECGQRGFPITKDQLFDCVQKFILDTNRKTPFKEGRPGKYWYYGFMRRHPQLSKRICQNLTTSRAAVTENQLRSWFSTLRSYLEKKNLLNISPKRVFNCDESSFMLVPKDNKVIYQRGARSVYKIVGYSEKAAITVLFMLAADGQMPPPLVLYNLKNPPSKNMIKVIPRDWGVGFTDSGWMTSDSFHDYIENVFFKWLKNNNYDFPVILYLDNHASHVTLPLLKFCKENGIELVALYPNSTHIIQPLDVAFFHPLKDAYKKAVRVFKVDNNVLDIKKADFPRILKTAIDSFDFTQTSVNGFKSCGLVPLDPDAVNYDVLNKKKRKTSPSVTEVNPENIENSQLQITDVDYEKLLRLFETQIPSATMKQFLENECQEFWSGEFAKRELFQSWLTIKKLSQNLNSADGQILMSIDSPSLERNIPSPISFRSDNAMNEELLTENRLQIEKQAHMIEPEIISSVNTLNSSELNTNLISEFIDEHEQHRSVTVVEIIHDQTADINNPIIHPNENIEKYFESMANEVELITNENIGVDDFIDFSAEHLDEVITLENVTETTLDKTNASTTVKTVPSSMNGTSSSLMVNDSCQKSDFKESSEEKKIPVVSGTTEINDCNSTVTLVPVEITSPISMDNMDIISNYSSNCNPTINQTPSFTGILDLSTNKTLLENDIYQGVLNSTLDQDASMNSNTDTHRTFPNSTDGEKRNIRIVNEESVSIDLEHYLKKPTFRGKGMKNKQNQNGPRAFVVDDLLKVHEQKENEKIVKQKEVEFNRQKKLKNRILKEKEINAAKVCKETKAQLLTQKKEIEAEIKTLKARLKTEKGKENLESIRKFEEMNSKLAEIKNLITLQEMQILQTKLQIKQEKL